MTDRDDRIVRGIWRVSRRAERRYEFYAGLICRINKNFVFFGKPAWNVNDKSVLVKRVHLPCELRTRTHAATLIVNYGRYLSQWQLWSIVRLSIPPIPPNWNSLDALRFLCHGMDKASYPSRTWIVSSSTHCCVVRKLLWTINSTALIISRKNKLK